MSSPTNRPTTSGPTTSGPTTSGPTTTTTRTAVAYRKPHPIRGILWGLLMGIGAAVVLILLKVIPLDLVWVVIVLAASILFGILWSTLGPAKKPKGDPPWHADQVTNRPDWDAQLPPEVPRRRGGPTSPVAPGPEPLNIQPLDVEPIDLDSPTSDVPPEATPETLPRVPDKPPDPVVDPPRTIDPPERSEPPPPPPPASPLSPPPPPPG